MKVNVVKPIKMMALTAVVAGAALVGGGAAIRNNRIAEENQHAYTDYSPIIEDLEEMQKSSALGRQLNSVMKESEKSYFQAVKENNRTLRDSQIESEKNRDLNQATNDLERTAIKAYALTKLTTNHIGDKLEDCFGN